ncbi:MAG: phosphatidylserine decarboxylase family protein [Phycisphaerae bacterium]|nr:phosphatidylserine decarboxylase family protein [Phycisphaerae bacterium]
MPLALQGLREMLVCTVVFGGGAALCAWGAVSGSALWWIPAIPLAAVWVFTIAFFRDPERDIPAESGSLVSPADGKITEITRVESHEWIDGPALKISIFLSIFDVHINRSPCSGRVLRTDYRAGEFLDARHPECGIRNECNTVVLEANEPLGSGAGVGPTGTRVVIRQVAGLIARRIICQISPGDSISRGGRIGLIKFGSRTDLIVPADIGLEPVVQVNDMVKGGSTILIRTVQSKVRCEADAHPTEPSAATMSSQKA